MSNEEKAESAYVRNGKAMATAAVKRRAAARAAPKPPKEPEAELPSWLRGDEAGRALLPKRPPGKP